MGGSQVVMGGSQGLSWGSQGLSWGSHRGCRPAVLLLKVDRYNEHRTVSTASTYDELLRGSESRL